VVIGVAVWQLHLHGCSSLKQKRSVLKSLKARLQNELKLSAAETAYHDVLQRAEIAACVVSTDQPHASSVLDSADRVVAGEFRARIIEDSRCYY
jgi:uncharacterized protein YlxP (DUF503 family)